MWARQCWVPTVTSKYTKINILLENLKTLFPKARVMKKAMRVICSEAVHSQDRL